MRNQYRLLALVILCCLAAGVSAGGSAEIREKATLPPALEGVDTSAVVQMLQDKRPAYRAQAAWELGRRKAMDAVTPLRTLLNDGDTIVRLRAAVALEELGDKSGLQVLRELLTSRDILPQTALKAVQVLARHGDEVGMALAKSELASPRFTHRMAALSALNASKNEETAYAALQIGLRDKERLVQAVAINLLEKRATRRGVDLLSSLLSDPDYSLRGIAVRAIGRTRLWDAVPVLLDALANPDRWVRYSAAGSLNIITGRDRPILQALSADRAGDLEREWREWWEANKDKRPSALTQKEPDRDTKAKP